MNRRWFTVILLLSLAAGGLYALYTLPVSPPPPDHLVDANDKVQEAREILERAETASREALLIRESLRREVRIREQTIHKEVSDYDADRIVAELNALCGDR